ncbi:MFS transporter [Pelagibacteraceae bacterium]|jgi:MFS family permease|nr:MFS transporter [Pelagibacteraceae bacterium]
MFKIFKNSWALFTGFAVLITAHGFQGNLLGVRSVIEEFNVIATGAIMSGYFVGYFFGANIIPNLVGKVGHIRVFAAFASMASLAILIHAVFVNPYVWVAGRFLTGLSLIGVYIVVESWLNDRATNRNRGEVLSIYMFITFFGLGLGTLLLNFSSPEKYEPFILISLLFSIALIPILLTKRKPPKFKKISSINIKQLYKISPLGTFSMFCTGFIHSAIFTLGAVYAAKMNFTIFEISLLLFLISTAGALFQWPIGYFSDRHDRRIIIICCTFISTIFCIFTIMSSGTSLDQMYLASSIGMDKVMFFIFSTLYAGFALPIFTLNLAYVNDFIQKEKFVAAGAGLQIIFGMGAMGGPLLCSIFMKIYGVNGFFVYLAIFHLIIGLFGMYRITKRSYEDNPQSTFTPLPRNITPLGIELDPTTAADLSQNDKK